MEKEIITVMKRYELKYRLNKEQVAYFKKRILEYMKIDKYGLTSICSIYFDTPNYSLINKSIEKPEFKEKLRLRSYGIAKKDSPVFLEIKRKNEKIVYKRRIMTNEDKAYRFFLEDEEFDNSQISRELQAFKESHIHLQPKYLIIYDRIAYYQDDSDVRITLDMNPRYRVDDVNLHTSLDGTPLLDESEAILEIKVQHSVPMWLVGILTEGKIYQSSFSKVGAAHKREMKNNMQKQISINHQIKEMTKGEQIYGFVI